MKKHEIIHTHGLLKEITDYYEDMEGGSVESNEYLSLGVQPGSIHRSKDSHVQATLALARGITSEIKEPGSTEYELETYFDEIVEKAVKEGVELGSDYVLSEKDVGLNRMILRELDQSEEYKIDYDEWNKQVIISRGLVNNLLEAS